MSLAFVLALLALALGLAFAQGTALEGMSHPLALMPILLPECVLAKIEESFFHSHQAVHAI